MSCGLADLSSLPPSLPVSPRAGPGNPRYFQSRQSYCQCLTSEES